MKTDINPALKTLEVLVGDWTMELSNASFLPDPTSTIRGSASFEWFEGGDFLIVRQGAKKSGQPWATWFIGRDQDLNHFAAFYIDDRRVSRVYEMSFEKGQWKMWRNAARFAQRFVGKLDTNGKLITGRWEKSKDGKNWEQDFDVAYMKA